MAVSIGTDNARAGRRNSPRIYAALVAITLMAIVVSLVISAPAWMPGHPRLTTPHNFGTMGEQSRERRSEQLKRLEQYAWRDRSAGIVAVPIDHAMNLMIDEAKRQQATGSQARDVQP